MKITATSQEINITIEDLTLTQVTDKQGVKYNTVMRNCGEYFEEIDFNSSECKHLFIALHNYKNSL